VFSTDTGWNVAPTGTVTDNDVADAEVTEALVAPKYTMLLDAVGLNWLPVMVTAARTVSRYELIDVIDGRPEVLTTAVEKPHALA
jgi:hypothetical protein